MTQNLLLEIGCEELPTSFLDGGLDQLATLLPEELDRARIGHGAARVLGTPRRLAVLVADVEDAVAARDEEVLGPPEKACRTPDGKWTAAAEGFARKNDLAVSDLTVIDTPKGRYVRGVKRSAGAPTRELLPAVLVAVCKRIAFAKSMRWADLDTAFGRPVQWLVVLHGETAIPFHFAGVTAGRTTRGHRFLAPDLFDLASADEYVDALRRAHVRVDPGERRTVLLEQLHAAARSEGGILRHDAFLEREVLGLVEEPHVLVGRFEDRFMTLPDSLIESVMRGHQRYFSVQRPDAPAGENPLLPRFLTVVNTAKDPETIIRGNEVVMRARLSDAAFFVAQDRQHTLASRAPALEGVAFHAKLGSYGDKTLRLAALASWCAGLFGADSTEAGRAGSLCKADLVTLTVGEFPELQGVMGRYYAGHDGETAAVADAIAEHHQPRSAADDVAPSKTGAALALADRLDTLVGCMAVGLRPTGSEDPFGLRRLAIGLLRTLMHHRARVSLAEAAGQAWDVYASENGKMLAAATAAKLDRAAVVTAVTDFCAERMKGLLEERFGRGVVGACMAARRDDPVDVLERVEALAAFWKTPAADDLGVAFKRVFNISREAPAGALTDEDRARLSHPSEVALIAAFEATAEALAPMWASRRYVDAMALIGNNLRAPVDRFFDPQQGVFVMDPDLALRASRLRLLGRIADSVGVLARFDALD